MKLKRALSAVLAAAMSMTFLSAVSLAASVSSPTGGISFHDSGSGAYVFNKDDEDVSSDFTINSKAAASSTVDADGIYFGQTYYFEVADTAGIAWNDLTSSTNFNFKLDRDKNGTYLESVKLTTRTIRGVRRAYIAVALKPATVTEEKNITFDVYFKARRAAPSGESGSWSNSDLYNARFDLWVSNDEQDGGDANIGTGEGVVFNPVPNEKNSITWGGDYDVASLEFTASSDADKFYAKLSTKVNSRIYEEYGDPVDADLYFRTFSGGSVDATSRATLTLYNPWDEYYYDDYDRSGIDPRNAYIYRLNGDYLEDITDQFAFVNADNTISGLDGWQTKLRTLGTYVISDRELDVSSNWLEEDPDIDGDMMVDPPTTPSGNPSTPLEPPAATGSSDFTAIAFAALAAAVVGAVVLSRKRR